MPLFRDRFAALGLAWPALTRPDLPFAPTARIGDIVYVSGQIPEIGDDLVVGEVGGTIDLAAAQRAAALCAANVLFWLAGEVDGELSRIVRLAKVAIYVNAVPGFTAYSEVGNGASELFRAVLGSAGEHTRVALGMQGLPLGVPVEVEAVAQVR